ncbi:copper resistance protein CopC [Nonomuraea sp. NBC_01738]|uniref:copper resistance CopC family protein n=1 Tax=Nonomuraea sp. NBC_01738 TaxID=2976003 RepID=UPI002E106A57|nr:copper resistance protein CopC [Nonomuraea sp. NBC_01738]
MRRLLTVLLLACVASVLWIVPAQAHNVLVGSDPKDGATLTAAPAQVTLVFDQAVRQGYAQVGVTAPGGAAVAGGKAVVAKEKVTVALGPLSADGVYVVGYRILSADGHPVTGEFRFTLATGGKPAATGAATQAATGTAAGSGDLSAQAAEAAANGGAGMAVVWIAAALVLLAAGTVIALRRSAPAGEGQR